MQRTAHRRTFVMTRAAILCLVVGLATCTVMATARPAVFMTSGNTTNPIVTIADGQLQGTVVDQAVEFLGIPFAEPPVLNLRWREPIPNAPWGGVRDATKFQPNCAQPEREIYAPTSEDCLYLNVFTPLNPVTKGPLPVMLWFYGGSWISGGAALPLYNGIPDELLERDVIIVTANYRLGAFGFLGSEKLRGRSGTGSTGLYGLLDQRLSMKWVQSNIAAFGGDAGNVTLFGESAGAGSISTHLVMEGSKGLFHRAMMESGPITGWVGTPMSVAEQRFSSVLSLTNCTDVDCLLGLSTKELEMASKDVKVPKIPQGPEVPQWGPVIDGVQLLGKPSELAAQGKIASKVATLLGSNRDEGSMFYPLPRDCTEDEVMELLAFAYGEDNVDTIMAQYPLSNFESPWYQGVRMEGDVGFTCSVRRTARWMLAAGAPASFVYFFTHKAYWIDHTQPWLGVAHTTELPFVFNFDLLLHGDAEIKLAQQVAGYWTNFAATGDPNVSPHGEKLVHWPAYDATSDVVANLNLTVSSIAHLKESACDMWDKVLGFTK